MKRSLKGATLLLIVWSVCEAATPSDSDERRGHPLSGIVSIPGGERPDTILVALSGPDFQRSTTAHSDGSFVFFGVPDGDYSIEVRCSGYFSTRTPIRHSLSEHLGGIRVALGKPADDTPVVAGPSVVSVATLKIPEKAAKEAERAAREKDNQRLDSAVKHYRKAIEIHPEYFEAWNNLGTIYLRLGNRAEAEEAFQNAIRVKPDASPSLRNLGFLYLKSGAPEKAVPLLTRACELTQHRDVFAETYLGFALYQEGRYDEAEASLNQALALEADFLAAVYQQGFVKAQLGKYDEAKVLFSRGLKLGASTAEAEQMRQMLSRLEKVTESGTQGAE